MTTPTPEPRAATPSPVPERNRRIDCLLAYLLQNPDGVHVSQIVSELGFSTEDVHAMLRRLQDRARVHSEAVPGSGGRPVNLFYARTSPAGPDRPQQTARVYPAQRHIDRLAAYLAVHPDGVEEPGIRADLGGAESHTRTTLYQLEELGYARRERQAGTTRHLWRPTALTARPVPNELPNHDRHRCPQATGDRPMPQPPSPEKGSAWPGRRIDRVARHLQEHPTGVDVPDIVAGTGAYTNAVRASLGALEKIGHARREIPTGDRRAHTWFPTDLTSVPVPLGLYAPPDPPPPPPAPDSSAARASIYLIENPAGVTARQICDDLGCPYAEAMRDLEQLERSGHAWRTWPLPPCSTSGTPVRAERPGRDARRCA
ncbi:hypothetical protein CLV63_11221 [Murinocardiopsis flavida]|uniref:Uncharacterized protein n=1 Tax=Murinocardiopsis flavida TaxID=645275 RepID=A0A2P8DG09_9ACTN|nr:hypothetical protein [Murinocardiopsis flavida]PSK96139.1 hypothetical protein CLV63_11221 [Murinocardiopsis flavida]